MDDKISSESLAVLIIDRLVYAKNIDKAFFEQGVLVAKSTINARKALGDYDGIRALQSIDLSMLIIDELIKAKLVSQADFEKAVHRADEEIIARQAAGDY